MAATSTTVAGGVAIEELDVLLQELGQQQPFAWCHAAEDLSHHGVQAFGDAGGRFLAFGCWGQGYIPAVDLIDGPQNESQSDQRFDRSGRRGCVDIEIDLWTTSTLDSMPVWPPSPHGTSSPQKVTE
jgi:hypothetical protein